MTPILHPLSRRRLIGLLGAGGLVAACSENAATGRSQLAFVSDEQLAQLAEGAWKDMLAKTPRAADAGLQKRLERIGGAVASASKYAQQAWEFVVFDSDQVTALVLPGGKVGFFRGLMEFAKDDGEIATVMGHEVGHVEARHAAERMSQQLLVQLSVQVAAMALSEEAGEYADDIAAAMGAGVMYGVILPYSRKHELEADALSVKLMRAADYDAAHAVKFWERMVERNGGAPGAMEWLSTHPADGRRLEALRAVVRS